MATDELPRCYSRKAARSIYKRVERLWRREGVQVPRRQPKRKRLWLNGGSCIRLRSSCRNHVWSYDFMQARTRAGRSYRLLTILDEHSRECLAIVPGRRLTHADTLECLSGLFVRRGVKTLYIEPGCPGENGYIESFNGKLRDEVLNREISNTVHETKVLVERWRNEYDYRRPHSAPGYRPQGRYTTRFGLKTNE